MKEAETYSYQEAEAIIHAYIRSARKLQALAYKGLVPWDSNKETFISRVLLEKYFSWASWGKNHSLIDENSKEEDLTVEQKNIIASHCKEEFDCLKESECAISNYINFISQLSEIGKEFNLFTYCTNSDEENIVFVQNLDKVKPLALTYGELYHVLSYLPEEDVRSLLSNQAPTVFHKLFAANNKDRDEFVNVAESLDVAPFIGLRQLVIRIIHEQLHEDLDLAMDTNLWHDLFVDVIGEDSRLVDLHDSVKLSDYPDISLFSNDFFMEIVWETTSKFVSFFSEFMPRLEKKRLRKVYENLRLQYAKAPALPDAFSDDCLKAKFYKLIIHDFDESLIASLHSLMAQNGNSIEEHESSSESRLSSNFPKALQRMREPDRLTLIKYKNGDDKEKILRKIFKQFCASVFDITEDQFVYLFGIGTKVPEEYNPPFFWTGDQTTFKHLLRILYDPIDRKARKLILAPGDEKLENPEHIWSCNKDRVAGKPIEDSVIGIVKEVSNQDLPPLE